MQIIYKKIDSVLLEKIYIKYGETAKNHIHTENGDYSVASVYEDTPVGFISAYTRNLAAPIGDEKDAYIDIIEVDAAYRRAGIAAEFVARAEEWAKKAGLLQIRAWSSQDKTEAIPMWRDFGYGLCPAKIWLERHNMTVDGYYAVKQLNPVNPYPYITKLIKQDIKNASAKSIQNFRLIRAKNGVYVYRCLYGGVPAVVKYFDKEGDRREIMNYRLLAQHEIPTIQTFALGEAAFVMEDISVSGDWRLGAPEDLADAGVAESLARWYFTFHENGTAVPELMTLYFEYDSFTEENFHTVIRKFPESKELFRFLLARCGRLRELIYTPSFTLTYNDFYWVNFVVRKDKTAAMMFDYNLLGKGYRYSDFRNVCSSMSAAAGAAFTGAYNRLYVEKYGRARTEAEEYERKIDDVAGDIFQIILAFTEKAEIPKWAESSIEKAKNGTLLTKVRQLIL